MKITHKNLKKGEIKVDVENLDDLWYLSSIIEAKDCLKGQTFRKVKVGDSENAKTSKKRIFVSIAVEKVDYEPGILRVSGKTLESLEDVPKGSYHTFNIEEGTTITIIKDIWYSYMLDKLQEATEAKQPNILICVLDREEAIFALSTRKGYQTLTSLEGDVQKKEDRAQSKGKFYLDVIKALEEYSERYKLENIILASPAFWKEEVLKHITDDKLKKKIVLATCSSVGDNAINEVLRRQEVQQVLKQDRIAKEMGLVEELLSEIKKDGPSVYGIADTEKASKAGAVKILLITDRFIHKLREDSKFDRMESIMRTVDKDKGEIHIITSEHDAGKKLDGLGGIGAMLRYKLNY